MKFIIYSPLVKTMKKRNFNKRADVFQLTLLLVLLFVVAIIGILFLTLAMKVNTFYRDAHLIQSDNSTADRANQIMTTTTPNTTDELMMLLFLGGTIGIVLSAVKTNYSPITIFLFIILLFIDLFIAAGFVNIYSAFASTPPLSEYSSTQYFTNIIFSRYTPLIWWVIGLLTLIIMYGKSGSDIP